MIEASLMFRFIYICRHRDSETVPRHLGLEMEYAGVIPKPVFSGFNQPRYGTSVQGRALSIVSLLACNHHTIHPAMTRARDRGDQGGRLRMVCGWQVSEWGGTGC